MKGLCREANTKLTQAEFILNDRGAIYHLDLMPGELATTIVLVGDPARVDNVAQRFDNIELTREHREFKSATGTLNGKRLSVLSTGIGVDNIDIVINEVDSLFNVDFETRTIKEEHTQLQFVRLGTSGCMQADISIGDLVVSKFAVGYDALPYHYQGSFSESEQNLNDKLKQNINWDERMAQLYAVEVGESLFDQLGDLGHAGITITANGFYGPQNRQLRLKPSQLHLFDDFQKIDFQGLRVLNYEMESSGLYAMATLLGHEAITLCTLLANRASNTFATDPSALVNAMLEAVLGRLTR